MHRRWTEADDARIAALVAAGATNAEIAEALDRSVAAVELHIWELRRAGALPANERRAPRPAPAERTPHTCDLCGTAWRVHPRCRVCTIGFGPGHVERSPYHDGLCYDCWLSQARRQIRRVRS